MASPIWEEESPSSPVRSHTEHNDDDVPLSFSSSMMSSNGRHNAASGVRRSHTVTAAGSRLHRISSGNSGSLSSSSSSTTSHDRPLSASTGVSRRTSTKATSPSLNRVVESSTSDEESQANQEQYPSNAYLPFDADVDDDYDNRALYNNATASLARHSSMPISRSFRRDASNPGAPWQRMPYQDQQLQQTISPPPTSAGSSNTIAARAAAAEQRIRSNSTAAEARLSGSSLTQASITSASSPSPNQPISPNAPTSPLNSGFVVTSRPNSQVLSGPSAAHQRNAVHTNHSHFAPPIAPSTLGHGRSLSSHGWSSTAEPPSATDVHQHSPAHSRHASDSLSGSTSFQNQHSLLGRVPSNASTSSSHARPNTGSNNSNHNSTSSPASPIDSSLLGQNNPWSPTAEERMHFRELSSTLNLATLRQQDTLPGNSLTDGIIESSITPGPISPPSSRRTSAFKEPVSSPRRANSLNTHGRGYRPNAIEEPVPQGPSARTPSSVRQPQRKNTPVLPPLVTSTEALLNGVMESTGSQNAALTDSLVNHEITGLQLGKSTGSSGAAPPLPKVAAHTESSSSGSKVIRGPASAAPYVPPIGHTHLSDKAGNPHGSASLPPGGRVHHEYTNSMFQHNNAGAAAPPPSGHMNHIRGFNTAGPGLPENIYLQERTRIAGVGPSQDSSQNALASSSQPRNHAQQGSHQQGYQQAHQQEHQNGQVSSGDLPLSPSGATSLSSAVALQFPSLNTLGDAANAAAFTTNLHLQQHLIAQQAQQLHDQHTQLVNAFAAGLTLQDRSLHSEPTNSKQINQLPASIPSLPVSPSGLPVLQQGLGNVQQHQDPYTIAAKIEALQKANAMLVAAMSDPNGHHTPLVQQAHDRSYQQPMHQSYQQPGSEPSGNPHGTFTHTSRQHTPVQSIDLGHPTSAFNGQAQHSAGIGPVDIHALAASKGYNPQTFNVHPPQARFFVIKSFTEDDVFKSIKFEIWSSTVLGNNRLDKAFAESSEKGPIYLFFSVNASGHFCGVAEMLTPLDYSVTSNVWAQGDKWKGVMNLRWIFIKDIPNPALRHLKLMNTNEQKPVTSSRDTQEVPYEQGCEMLRIFSTYQSKTSLLQDFAYYQAQTAAPVPGSVIPSATSKSQYVPSGTPLQPAPAAFTQAGHPSPYRGQASRSPGAAPVSSTTHQNFSHKQVHPHRR